MRVAGQGPLVCRLPSAPLRGFEAPAAGEGGSGETEKDGIFQSMT